MDNSWKQRHEARRAIVKAASLTAGRANLDRFNATRHLRPTCNAVRRTTGEPCRNLPLENGRCRFHGGAVPRGRNWHKVQLANASGSVAKLDKKLEEVRLRELRRAACVAAMTPEQRERYDQWHVARKPGGKAARAATKQARRNSAELIVSMRHVPRAATPELIALDRMLDEARTHLELVSAIEEGRGG